MASSVLSIVRKKKEGSIAQNPLPSFLFF